jgi:release factor glutamine methyltransferase
MAFGTITARDALDSALIALRAAGVESPRLDAELLVAAACGVDRAALVRDPELALPPDAIAPLREAVRRRAFEREPLAYVLGSRHFRHIELAVDHRVLIPRPETELLVEVALALPRGARVLDVGTGSGAVALALADERPDLVVAGSDSSEDAVTVARANAARLGLDVSFAAGDLLAPLQTGLLDGRVDAVVCNPPYVADGDRLTLAPEIVRHEPSGALFAGDDGLRTIRRLVAQAGAARVAWLALEVGAGQADTVTALMRAAGYREVETHPDLASIPRVLTAAWGPA